MANKVYKLIFMALIMKWVLDYNNNQVITVNMLDLKALKDSALEGKIEYFDEAIFPCFLEISEDGNSINGFSFKIDKPIKYALKIRQKIYEMLSPGYKQEIHLNKYNETLTFIVE